MSTSGYQNQKEREHELNKARLVVRVIEARGLKAADWGGTSDPFTELRIKASTIVHKTRTIKKTLNPMWNEEFILYPTNTDTDILSVKVYDFDTNTSNDLIGELEIPLVAIVNKPQGEEIWRPLMEKKGPTTFVPLKGEICMQINYFEHSPQSPPPVLMGQPMIFYPPPMQGQPMMGQPVIYYTPQGQPMSPQPMYYPQQGQPMSPQPMPMYYPQQGQPMPMSPPPVTKTDTTSPTLANTQK